MNYYGGDDSDDLQNPSSPLKITFETKQIKRGGNGITIRGDVDPPEEDDINGGHKRQKLADAFPYNSNLTIAQEKRGSESRHARSSRNTSDGRNNDSQSGSMLQDMLNYTSKFNIRHNRNRNGNKNGSGDEELNIDDQHAEQDEHGYWDIAKEFGVISASRGNTVSTTGDHLNTYNYETNINQEHMPLHHHNNAITSNSNRKGLQSSHDLGEYHDYYGKPLYEDIDVKVRDTNVNSIVGSRTVTKRNANGTYSTSTLKEVGTTTGVMCFSNNSYLYNDTPYDLSKSKEVVFHASLKGSETSVKKNRNNLVRDGTAYGHDHMQQRILLPEEEQEIIDAHLSSNVATLRTYINALCKSSEDVKKLNKAQLIKLLQNLLIFPEHELCRPEERQKLILTQKFSFLRNFLDEKFFSIFQKLVAWGFSTWKENMDFMIGIQRHVKVKRIQTCVRRWLCRVSLFIYY